VIKNDKQVKRRIHVNRTAGCYSHYCTIDVDTDAGFKEGEGTWQAGVFAC
jgi:hypothetical protein